MKKLLFIIASLTTGIVVSFLAVSNQTIMNCKDTGKTYHQRNYGYPLQFKKTAVNVPACKSYTSTNCFNGTCQHFRGMKLVDDFKMVPLVLDVAVWSVTAAGVLYIISALVIRK